MPEETEKPIAESEAAAPVEKQDDNIKEVKVDQMPVVVDKDVQEETGDGLLESMLAYLKRYNGYKCCSVSRIENIPSDVHDWSPLLMSIFQKYMIAGKADPNKFKEMFASKDMCYIQVHEDYPTVAKDGCYSSITIDGKMMKTITVGFFRLVNADTFKPLIIVRRAPGKVGDPGTLGLVYGDPYHQVSPEEAAEIIKENQPQAVATEDEIAAAKKPEEPAPTQTT